MALNSQQMRPVIEEALRRRLGREPTLNEVYLSQALARFDGGYGNFKSPPHGPEGPTSNNMGAVQHPDLPKYAIWRGVTNSNRNAPEVKALFKKPGPPSPKPDEWFYASDFQGVDRGGKGWFWGPYKVYKDPVEGAMDKIRILQRMGVLELANSSPNWLDIARRMYEKRYFFGYSHRTPEENIRDYARNLQAGAEVFEKLFKERSPIGWDSSPKAPGVVAAVSLSSLDLAPSLPLLRRDSKGPAVRLWQRIVGAKDDGVFGGVTERRTMEFQRDHRLLIDGIVGPATWSEAP